MKLPFDEMLDASGKARPHYQIFHNWLKQQSDTLMGLKRAEADLIFRRVGITFAVYGDDGLQTKMKFPPTSSTAWQSGWRENRSSPR